jgi:hypothetical protein
VRERFAEAFPGARWPERHPITKGYFTDFEVDAALAPSLVTFRTAEGASATGIWTGSDWKWLTYDRGRE